jgi:hypothetical protein
MEIDMEVKLSYAEGDLLAHMSADVLQRVTDNWKTPGEFTVQERRTAGRLVKKGLVEKRGDGALRINAAGIERAKTVY